MKRFLAIISLAAFGGIAQADESADETGHHIFDQRFQVYIGGFFPEVNSEITINGDILPPSLGIDFEDVFGLEESKSVLWGGARWQISRRNHLEVEYVQLDRDGSVTAITDPVEIGDSVIQAGAQVDSSFDVTLARLTYGFSVYQTDNVDIQLKGGLHLLDASVGVQATGAVCVDGEVPPDCTLFGSTPRDEREEVTAPLPHIGGSFIYSFHPEWAVRLAAIGFAVELDNIDGSITEIDADILWNPFKHLGFGLGVRYFDVNVESKGSSLDGEFQFDYFGPSVYAALLF